MATNTFPDRNGGTQIRQERLLDGQLRSFHDDIEVWFLSELNNVIFTLTKKIK